MNLTVLFDIIFWGLYAGCIYILLAIGLNLIFGVMKVVNFAHGELLMLSIYITFFIHMIFNVNPYLVVPVTMLVMFFIGIFIERLCFRPIMGTGKLNEIFLSLGLIYLLQNTVALVWGSDFRSIRSPFENDAVVFGLAKIQETGREFIVMNLTKIQNQSIGDYIPIWLVRLPLDYVIIIFVTIFLLILLQIFLRKTTIGMNMRATSQNREAAMLTGINVEWMDMISFGLGSALAAAAGSLWCVSGVIFNPYVGSIPAIKAFAVIILGGLGSIEGAIAGGLIYGMAENFASYIFGGAWKDATSFIILLIVLILKPTGLFGESNR